MEQLEKIFICPKCKSAPIKIDETNEFSRYRCENSVGEDIFCTWLEIECKNASSDFVNDNPAFLSTYLFQDYSNSELRYEHLYLMGEMVNLSNMTTLAKKGKLKDVLAEKILDLHPEWSVDPLKNMFNYIKQELLNNSLKFNGHSEPHLMIGDFIPSEKFIQSNYSFEDRIEILSKTIRILMEDCHKNGNIFVFTQNYFSNGEFIPISEELMIAFDIIKSNSQFQSVNFKRYIILPAIQQDLIKTHGLDTQAISILHFVKSNDYYYDKIAIVEPSFWKKWEFGSRNAPYNPFGKDPGAFWVRSSLTPKIISELEGKTIKEQANIINRTGQEKFQYVPLNIREAIARCILLGCPIGAKIIYIQCPEMISDLNDKYSQSSILLHQELLKVSKKLKRVIK